MCISILLLASSAESNEQEFHIQDCPFQKLEEKSISGSITQSSIVGHFGLPFGMLVGGEDAIAYVYAEVKGRVILGKQQNIIGDFHVNCSGNGGRNFGGVVSGIYTDMMAYSQIKNTTTFTWMSSSFDVDKGAKECRIYGRIYGKNGTGEECWLEGIISGYDREIYNLNVLSIDGAGLIASLIIGGITLLISIRSTILSTINWIWRHIRWNRKKSRDTPRMSNIGNITKAYWTSTAESGAIRKSKNEKKKAV